MKRTGIIIISIFSLLLAIALVTVLFLLENKPENTSNIQVETPIENITEYTDVQQTFYDVNEVLTNYEQYVNRKIVIRGLVKTRGGDSFKIGDATNSTPPKYADTIEVHSYFKTEWPDSFTVGDVVLISGKYTGTMYSLQRVEFDVMADKIELMR